MKKLGAAIWKWLDDRTSIAAFFERILAGEVEKNGAWLRTTGMAIFVLVLVECVTGPILGLYYTPSPTQAYDDIVAIQANPMGRFLRGIHHFSSAAILLLIILMVGRMFFGHEYKKRHDFVWVITLLFAQLALFFQLTGHILPWDTNAAGTANVEAGFAGNLWGIGAYLKRFILGGSAVGGVTLTRWYGFHTLVFPLALLLVVGLPLLAHRLRRPDDPDCPDDPDPLGAPPHECEPYFPWHLAREMAVALAVFLALAALAWFRKAPLELEATADNLAGYQAYSEWYVLPLHALTLLPPFNNVAFEPIATLLIPGGVLTILIALPFLYRMPNRPKITMPVVPIMGALIIMVAAGLYMYAFTKERPQAQKQIERIAILKGEKQILIDTNLVADGKKLYAAQSCDGCHAIAGQGGKVGPNLTKAGLLHPDREWQIKHLAKPDAEVPGSTMPAYGHLKTDELRALAEYMLSLR